MAHHSSRPDPEFAAFLAGAADADQKLGATGAFPRGKLMDTDEGETRIAIGHAKGAVVMDFGSPTSWIGFTPEQADQMADTLRDHAREVREGR